MQTKSGGIVRFSEYIFTLRRLAIELAKCFVSILSGDFFFSPIFLVMHTLV
jgi:hypothetical protein